MNTETITWHPIETDGPPDADITHQVTLEAGNDPVWIGWWDGDVWRDASTGAPFVARVTAWAEFPMGYGACPT